MFGFIYFQKASGRDTQRIFYALIEMKSTPLESQKIQSCSKLLGSVTLIQKKMNLGTGYRIDNMDIKNLKNFTSTECRGRPQSGPRTIRNLTSLCFPDYTVPFFPTKNITKSASVY